MSQPKENNSLTMEQAKAMLDLQGQMNEKVNPNWLHAGYQFLRAVLVEGGEAIDHHGWKWWKAQVKDLAQLRLELVDVFHFMLSDLIIKAGGNIEQAVADLIKSVNSADEYVDFDGHEYDIFALDTVEKPRTDDGPGGFKADKPQAVRRAAGRLRYDLGRPLPTVRWEECAQFFSATTATRPVLTGKSGTAARIMNTFSKSWPASMPAQATSVSCFMSS